MSEAINALKIVCDSVKGKSTVLSFFSGGDKSKMVEVTEIFTEIFPDVKMRAIFKEKSGGKSFLLEAKAGSKIDIHQALPERFIYIAYGSHREPITGNVYRKGDEYRVHANAMSGAEFSEDSQLLIEVPI